MASEARHRTYGLLARFESAQALLDAARSSRSAGYRDIEAYAPFMIEGLAETVGKERNGIPLLTLLGGGAAASVMFGLQWYSSVVDYPINVGGRPYFSWPAFILPALEVTFLGAAVAAVAGMLFFNRLPQFRHPVFAAPGFERATRDGFFLCIRGSDPLFDEKGTRAWLLSQFALEVTEVVDE
jgi:hypothetical protein